MSNKPSVDTILEIERLKAHVTALTEEVRGEREAREDTEEELASEKASSSEAENNFGMFVGDIFNICEAMSACNPKKPWSRVRVDDRDEALKMLHAIVDEMEAAKT